MSEFMIKFQYLLVVIKNQSRKNSHFDLAHPVCTCESCTYGYNIRMRYIDESHLRFFVVVTIASIQRGKRSTERPFNH